MGTCSSALPSISLFFREPLSLSVISMAESELLTNIKSWQAGDLVIPPQALRRLARPHSLCSCRNPRVSMLDLKFSVSPSHNSHPAQSTFDVCFGGCRHMVLARPNWRYEHTYGKRAPCMVSARVFSAETMERCPFQASGLSSGHERVMENFSGHG